MILFLLSLLAGVLTVLAPCTLPLIPVIVGSSSTEGKNTAKALRIVFTLALSVILFTLVLKFSTALINIPQSTWSLISGVIIILFGLVSVFPSFWENLPFIPSLFTNSNKLLGVGYKKENYLGDFIIGASLGPVFTTCSPTYFIVLATVLPQSFFTGLIYLFAYAFGLAISLLVLSVLGQKIIDRVGNISDTHGLFRKILGFVFIILGLLIIFGVDKKIEKAILETGFFDITKIEQRLLKLNENSSDVNLNDSKKDGIAEGGRVTLKTPIAKEIINPSGYINTEGKPITIGEFRGKKVVLLDIWTYSCINCQRTLPYLKAWHEKYKDKGLVIIGLHTPEFAFEKVKSNVEDAVKRFGVSYPVVMDNNYSTWTAYGNQYWPRKYLISGNGEIVYDHIGEGKYEETERAIQKALLDLNKDVVVNGISTPSEVVQYDPRKVKSPEIYFGASRNEYLANGRSQVLGQQVLTLPKAFDLNMLYLEGSWNFYPEYVVSNSPAKIFYKYDSKNVYMVASSDKGQTITVYVDGKKVKDIYIKENKLYNIVEGVDYGQHELLIETPGGLNAFTFTFG